MAKVRLQPGDSATGRVGVAAAALTGSVTAGTLYLLCWLIAMVAGGAMRHFVLELFTSFGTSPVLALVEGLVWSWVVGSLAGALIALIYNGLAERR
jgi:hypothetical protein